MIPQYSFIILTETGAQALLGLDKSLELFIYLGKVPNSPPDWTLHVILLGKATYVAKSDWFRVLTEDEVRESTKYWW